LSSATRSVRRRIVRRPDIRTRSRTRGIGPSPPARRRRGRSHKGVPEWADASRKPARERELKTRRRACAQYVTARRAASFGRGRPMIVACLCLARKCSRYPRTIIRRRGCTWQGALALLSGRGRARPAGARAPGVGASPRIQPGDRLLKGRSDPFAATRDRLTARSAGPMPASRPCSTRSSRRERALRGEVISARSMGVQLRQSGPPHDVPDAASSRVHA